MRKLLSRIVLFGSIIIIGIMVIKTITFSSKQLFIEPVKKLQIHDNATDVLAKAIRIKTISGQSNIDSLAFRNLDSLILREFPLVDSFLEKRRINEFSYVYKWSGINQNINPVLLLAHTDVVPIEKSSEKSWSQSPFSGSIDGGYIWGRGTLDDKMNVFGILSAVEMLLEEDYIPERTVYLAFGHDEETGGHHGAEIISKKFEEEGVKFEYILDEGSLIIEDVLPGLEQPLAMIGLTEKGYVTLELSVTLDEGGHSSMPPKETAIGILSKAVSTLEENPFPAKIDGATAELLNFAGPEMSLFYKVLFANLWLTKPLLKKQFGKSNASNALVRTTTAPTIIQGGVKENVLPTHAKAAVNFRILPGENVESVKEYVIKTIQDERVKVNGYSIAFSNLPTKISSTESFGFQVIHKTIGQIFPNTVIAPGLVVAGTDSRYYQNVSDNIYRFMPIQLAKDDLKRFHGIDERVGVEDYKNMVRFYRQLILNSCK